MNDDDAVQAIELFARASVEVTSRALAEAAPGVDLTLLQWRALRIVGDDPAGARVGQVGEGVGVPLPAASRLVQRLQQRGLVHVQRDPDDGRALRVRLTHAGSHARSTVLARRRSLISEALDQTVLPAEAVNGLRVVAERFAQLSREIPAPRTGPTWSPERGTMNESDTKITETGTPDQAGRYARNDPGSFAAGEEQTPEKDAENRSHPGTFGDTEPTA
jgi:DNA-binding MarR family transcriptional regulator